MYLSGVVVATLVSGALAAPASPPEGLELSKRNFWDVLDKGLKICTLDRLLLWDVLEREARIADWARVT